MDKISFDKMAMPLTADKLKQNDVKQSPDSSALKKEEGVKVSQHLSQWVAFLSSDEETMSEESARVSEMKQKIQSGDYQINFDALSKKMIDQGVITTSGILS